MLVFNLELKFSKEWPKTMIMREFENMSQVKSEGTGNNFSEIGEWKMEPWLLPKNWRKEMEPWLLPNPCNPSSGFSGGPTFLSCQEALCLGKNSLMVYAMILHIYFSKMDLAA